MNELWSDNPPQWGNYGQVPTPAKKIRVVLNGVYLHRVSASEYFVDNDNQSPTYFAGIFIPGTYTPDPILFDRYGVAKDSVLNLIVAPNYAGTTVGIGGVARGFGINPAAPQANWVKVFNSFAYYRWRRENEGNPNVIPGYIIPDNSRSATANTFCHELGHLFGLIHPFEGGNSCADLNTNQGRCNGGNLMSYCDATGNALSPCQLEVAHANLVNPRVAGMGDYTPYQSHSLSPCDVVPPRAFFTLTSCGGNPDRVFMDSRGTFNARSVSTNVYDTSMNLLVSRTTRAQPNGRWNIGQLLTLSSTADYWVELMAYGGAGTSHRSRQLMRVNTLPDPCAPIMYTPN